MNTDIISVNLEFFRIRAIVDMMVMKSIKENRPYELMIVPDHEMLSLIDPLNTEATMFVDGKCFITDGVYNGMYIVKEETAKKLPGVFLRFNILNVKWAHPKEDSPILTDGDGMDWPLKDDPRGRTASPEHPIE